MKSIQSRVAALSFALFLSVASVAEARIGGGRSGGFRGSRGFGNRTYQTTPRQNPYGGQQQAAPQQNPYGGAYRQQPAFGGGSFTRGLMGGIAGGFLGSLLFRGLGHAGYGGFGGSGIGLIEILLFAAIGYWLFRRFSNRHAHAGAYSTQMSHYEKLRSVPRGPFAQPVSDDPVAKLQSVDPGFDVSRFQDERMDDFMRLQAAWNHRDLSSIASLLGPELKQTLEADVAQLKASGRINRVENIAVRGAELVEAWQEYGQEFATVRFRANLTDYTIDERTGEVVAGDRVQPVKFEEDWTFVRDISGREPGGRWVLSAIEPVSEAA